MDYAGGGVGNAAALQEKIHTARLNARLPPRNVLTCTLLLDQISSSRVLNQHVGGPLKKVLPGFMWLGGRERP